LFTQGPGCSCGQSARRAVEKLGSRCQTARYYQVIPPPVARYPMSGRTMGRSNRTFVNGQPSSESLESGPYEPIYSICHQHWRRAVICLFRRSYRHTRIAASTTAASIPAWSTRHPTSLCLPGLIRPRAVHLLGMHRPHPSPIRFFLKQRRSRPGRRIGLVVLNLLVTPNRARY